MITVATVITVLHPWRVRRCSRPPKFTASSSLRVCIALLLLSVVACASPATTGLRAELDRYLRNLNDWAPAEAETARTIDRILATQFVDEAEVRRQIAADAPRARSALERIQAFRSSNPEIGRIHEAYVQGWADLVEGYASILAGLDENDAAHLAAGRRALEAWRATVLRTAEGVRRLMDETGFTTRHTTSPQKQERPGPRPGPLV